MSATGLTRPVPHLAGGPEALLRVGDIGGTAAAATGTMRTGPWVRDDAGVPAPGALGVLVDVVWGGAAVACAPPGLWGVSTELSVSLAAGLPDDGSPVSAAGAVVHQDAHGALATGSVTTADGRTLAVGAQRTRFLPGEVAGHPFDPAVLPGASAGGILELLGVETAVGGYALTATELLANPAGNVHGGILFAISELAAARAIGAREAGLSAELVSILYLRPARMGEEIHCEVEVVRRGRTAATTLARCVAADGRVRALATVQFGPGEASNPHAASPARDLTGP